jgi:hypothetical protein
MRPGRPVLGRKLCRDAKDCQIKQETPMISARLGKANSPESMVKEFRIGPQRSWSVVAFTIITAAGFQSVGDR